MGDRSTAPKCDLEGRASDWKTCRPIRTRNGDGAGWLMVYETDGQERFLGGHQGRLFLLITLLLVCLRLGQRGLPPLLPTIIDDLGITAFLAGAALTLLRVARASMEYPSGRYADRLSRTTVLLMSLGLAIAGVAILALAVNYAVFIIGVTVLGMSLGLYGPASRALISDLYHEKRGRAFGLFMMGSDLPGVFAAGLAVWVVAVSVWRVAFLPLFLVLLPLPFVLYRLSREPLRIVPVGLGLRNTGARLLGDSSMRWLLVVYTLFVASGGMSSFLPTFLIEVHGFSFAFASSAIALVYTVGIFAKPASGVISDRIPRPVVASGSLVLAGCGLGVLATAPVDAVVIGGVVLYAVGQRGVPPALQAYLMDRFPDESMGGDLGAMRTIYLTIGSLGPVYVGLVASILGFVPAYLSLVVFFVLGGAILSWFSVFGWPP